MKKTIKNLFIAMLVVVPMVSTVQKVSATFPDVPADHIYADAINYVQEEGIVSGYSDGEFKAENTITRGEFTKIIVEVFFGDEYNYDFCLHNNYLYVDDGSPKFYEDVELGTYLLYNPHTEEYMEYPLDSSEAYLKLDFNYMEYIDYVGGNKFSQYICQATVKGLIKGYSDGSFKPGNPITVGEASKIISNAYGLTDIQNPADPDKFKPFVDALSDRKAIPEGIISIGDYLKRGEMAEIIYRLENNITTNATKNYLQLKYSDFIIEQYINDELGIKFNMPNDFIVTSSENGLDINPSIIPSYISVKVRRGPVDEYLDFLIEYYSENETDVMKLGNDEYTVRNFGTGEGNAHEDGKTEVISWGIKLIVLNDDLYLTIDQSSGRIYLDGEKIDEYYPSEYDKKGINLITDTFELI